MHVLDWILLFVLAVSVLSALWKGFVHEILMMAATVLGIILATWQYAALARHWTAIQQPAVRDFLAWISIFVAVLLVAALVARLARKLIEVAGLRWFDRLLGGALGLVRGVVICIVLLVMLTVFPFDLGLVRDSQLAPDLLVAGDLFADVLPGQLQRDFQSGLSRLRQSTDAPRATVVVPPAAARGTPRR